MKKSCASEDRLFLYEIIIIQKLFIKFYFPLSKVEDNI